jgi:hypothetical protein
MFDTRGIKMKALLLAGLILITTPAFAAPFTGADVAAGQQLVEKN